MSSVTTKVKSGALVRVSIPEYPLWLPNNERGSRYYGVALAGEFVTVGPIRFKQKDLEGALSVLGYSQGPTYSAQAAADAKD